MASPP